MSRRTVGWVWAAAWLVGCEADEGAGDPAAVAAEPTVQVMRALTFGRIDGVTSPGFDLDGHATAQGESAGCDIADLSSPDGAPGIDNSFGSFLPVLEAAGGLAVTELVQETVESGELLLSLTLQPEQADGCVPVEVARADGVPVIGGDGRILAGQTFDPDPEFDATTDACAEWVDGTLVVNVDSVRIAFAVFDEWLDLIIHDVRFGLTPDDAGGFYGAMAGGLDVTNIQENVHGLDAIPSEIDTVVDTVLSSRADLRSAPEGACDRVSAVLVYESVQAFWFE